MVVLGRSKNVNHFITINDSETDKNIPYVAGKIEAEKLDFKKVNSETDIRIVYPSWVVGNGYLKKPLLKNLFTPWQKKINFYVLKEEFL